MCFCRPLGLITEPYQNNSSDQLSVHVLTIENYRIFLQNVLFIPPQCAVVLENTPPALIEFQITSILDFSSVNYQQCSFDVTAVVVVVVEVVVVVAAAVVVVVAKVGEFVIEVTEQLQLYFYTLFIYIYYTFNTIFQLKDNICELECYLNKEQGLYADDQYVLQLSTENS